MKMNNVIVNLTPEEVVVYSEDKSTVTHRVPPSISDGVYGSIAYVKKDITPPNMIESINGIPLVHIKERNEIRGFPTEYPPGAGVTGPDYIVEPDVLRVMAGCGPPHTMSPDYSPDSVVKDKNGKILGVRRFIGYIDPVDHRLPKNVFNQVMEKFYPDQKIRAHVTEGMYLMDWLEHSYNYAKTQSEEDGENVVKLDSELGADIMDRGFWYFNKLIKKHKVGWRDWSFDENRKIRKIEREIIGSERVDSPRQP